MNSRRSVRRRLIAITLLAGAPLLTGCGGLLDLLQPNQVTVRLDNNGQFDVDAVVIYSDQTDVPEDLIGTIGTRLEFTIPAGGSQSFTRSCGSLRAIQIQDASLRVLGGVGPHTSSGVYREGTDYTCGDTLTFAFEHSALIVDFHVTFSAQ